MSAMPLPQPGDPVPAIVRRPTSAQLFLFSAATWNAHRIHYDQPYAREHEGYPDVLVQAHLHACFLAQVVRGACGPGARLRRFGWQNRGPAVPGDELTVTGTVSAVTPAPDGVEVVFELAEHNQRGELCVKGWATALVPGKAA
jgi:hydroxyacyl-ACP dehydratase HTD2-like protein with hotdog domain